jgi:hypothetical protein
VYFPVLNGSAMQQGQDRFLFCPTDNLTMEEQFPGCQTQLDAAIRQAGTKEGFQVSALGGRPLPKFAFRKRDLG